MQADHANTIYSDFTLHLDTQKQQSPLQTHEKMAVFVQEPRIPSYDMKRRILNSAQRIVIYHDA